MLTLAEFVTVGPPVSGLPLEEVRHLAKSSSLSSYPHYTIIVLVIIIIIIHFKKWENHHHHKSWIYIIITILIKCDIIIIIKSNHRHILPPTWRSKTPEKSSPSVSPCCQFVMEPVLRASRCRSSLEGRDCQLWAPCDEWFDLYHMIKWWWWR